MTQQAQATQAAQPASREWFWRIVAGLMLVALGWTGWVAYQLTPVSVVTPAAYQALTQARAAARNVQEGQIRPAVPPELPVALQNVSQQAPRKAPVDVEKLRLSESIETPIVTK